MRGPWRSVDDVEVATMAWVDWSNQTRILLAHRRRLSGPVQGQLVSWLPQENRPQEGQGGPRRPTWYQDTGRIEPPSRARYPANPSGSTAP